MRKVKICVGVRNNHLWDKSWIYKMFKSAIIAIMGVAFQQFYYFLCVHHVLCFALMTFESRIKTCNVGTATETSIVYNHLSETN